MKLKNQNFFKGLTLFFFCATQLAVTPVHAADNVAQLTQNPTGNLVPVKPIEEVAVELQAKQPAIPDVAKKDSPLSQATARELDAKSIKEELGLAFSGNDYRNWSGEFDEKWLKGKDRAWYYIVPTGELYRWKGTREGMTQEDDLVGILDTFYHENLAWTKNLSAEALRDEFGFKTSGDFSPNWSKKLDERWFQDAGDQWYYIIPDGSVYRWDSETRAGMPTGDTYVAQLEPKDHGNLNWLSSDKALVEFQYGEGHLALEQVSNRHILTITDRSNGSLVREFEIQPDFNFDSARGILRATTVDGNKVYFAVHPQSGAALFSMEDTAFSNLFEANIERLFDWELRRSENNQLDFVLRSSGHREPTGSHFAQSRTHQPFTAPISLFVTRLNTETNVVQNLVEYSIDRNTGEESLTLKNLSGATIFSGVVTSSEFTTEESGIVTAMKFKTARRTTIDVTVIKEGVNVVETLKEFQYGEGYLTLQRISENGAEKHTITITDPADGSLIREFEVQPNLEDLLRPGYVTATTVNGEKIYLSHNQDTGEGNFGIEDTVFSDLYGINLKRVADWTLKRTESGQLDFILRGRSYRDPAFPDSIQSFIQTRIHQPLALTPVSIFVIRNTENQFHQRLIHYFVDSDTGEESLTLVLKGSIAPVFSGVVTLTSLTTEDSGLLTGAQFKTEDGKLIDVSINTEGIDVKITETLLNFSFGREGRIHVVQVTENGENRTFVRVVDPLEENKVVEEIEIQEDFTFKETDNYPGFPSSPVPVLDARDLAGNALIFHSYGSRRQGQFEKNSNFPSTLYGEDVRREDSYYLERIEGSLKLVLRSYNHDWYRSDGGATKLRESLQSISFRTYHSGYHRIEIRRLINDKNLHRILLGLSRKNLDDPQDETYRLFLTKLGDVDTRFFDKEGKLLEVQQESSGLVTALKFEANDGTIIDVTVTPKDLVVRYVERPQYTFFHEGKRIYALINTTDEAGVTRTFARIYDPGQEGKVIQEFELGDTIKVSSTGTISAETINGHTITLGKGDIFGVDAIAYLHVLIPTTSGVFGSAIEKEIYFNLSLEEEGLVVTPYLTTLDDKESVWGDLQLIILDIRRELRIRRGVDPDATHFLRLEPVDFDEPNDKRRRLHISVGRDPDHFPDFNEILFDGIVKVEDINIEESGLVVNASFLSQDGTQEIIVTVTKEGIETEILERVAD